MNKGKKCIKPEFQMRREIQKVKSYYLQKDTTILKGPTVQNTPIKNTNGTWTINNMQNANQFAEHLENTLQPTQRFQTKQPMK